MKIHNKLVRDKILEIIESNGKKCNYRIAEKDEHLNLLQAKLTEEVNEFMDAKNLDHTEEELLELRKIKKEKSGGFDNGIVLEKVYQP